MVSKNNTQWRLQHEAQRHPHYGIRKLSVGVASVLLSTTFYLGMTSVAYADTANPQQVTDQQAATALNTVQNNANEVKLSTPAASTNVSANTDTKSKAVIDNTVSSTSASSQVEQQAAENTQAVQPTQPTQPAQPANTDSGTTLITGAAAAANNTPTPTTPTATGNDRAAAVPVTNNHVQPTATAASVQPADNQQSQTDARQLPQTGNERQSGLFAGLIAGIGAITLGFRSRKRKHN